MLNCGINENMRFLVIGCGSIGKRHLRNLQSLGISNLIAVDTQDNRRSEVEAKFNIKTFPDLAAALSHGADVAIICTPTKYHIANALQAAKFGCHLFIEKPLSDSLVDLNKLVDEINKRQLKSFVGCNFRFDPGMIHAKRLIDENKIGRIISVRSQFGQYLPNWHPWEDYRKTYSARKDLGGGVLLDRIHEINYLRWLLGEIEEVYALVGHLSQLEIDTEDTSEILARFCSGAFGSIHLDYIRPVYDCSLEIVGENGIILWSFQDRQVRWYLADEKTWQSKQWSGYDNNQIYLDEMGNFLKILQGETYNENDVCEGIKDLQIIIAVKKSAIEKKPITIYNKKEYSYDKLN